MGDGVGRVSWWWRVEDEAAGRFGKGLVRRGLSLCSVKFGIK